MKPHRALFAALALLAAAAAPTGALGDPDYFLHGHLMPTAGRVGQPFHTDVAFDVEDLPANCVAGWKDMAVSGVLPPGLAVVQSFSSVIAGTPTAAGDWPVVVTFNGLGCTYNAKNTVNRALKVVFHIAP